MAKCIEEYVDTINRFRTASSTLYFRGTFTKLPPVEDYEFGDIIFNGVDNKTYMKFENEWTPLCSLDDLGSESEEFEENFTAFNCVHCGAPIKIISKYHAICEYCGTPYER